MKKEFHIPATKDTAQRKLKAVNILADHTGLSKQNVKQAMVKGAVWIEGNQGIRRIRRADTQIGTSDNLHFYYAPEILAATVATPTLIADEGDYSVWHKPCGMLCQGSKWSDHCTIDRWVETHTPFEDKPQRNCFIVHRLDRAARGLILLAHKKKVATNLAALFEKRAITKHYRAIVAGDFGDDKLTINTEIDGKPAATSAQKIAFNSRLERSLLDVSISSGRKHQIRIHLSRAGYPIIGDRLHGTDSSPQDDLQLSAFSLSFHCPVTHQIRYYEQPAHLQLTL